MNQKSFNNADYQKKVKKRNVQKLNISLYILIYCGSWGKIYKIRVTVNMLTNRDRDLLSRERETVLLVPCYLYGSRNCRRNYCWCPLDNVGVGRGNLWPAIGQQWTPISIALIEVSRMELRRTVISRIHSWGENISLRFLMAVERKKLSSRDRTF